MYSKEGYRNINIWYINGIRAFRGLRKIEKLLILGPKYVLPIDSRV